MASIVKDRRKLMKRVNGIGPRCEEYDSHCYNCFRYKFLDHYKAFPTRDDYNDWFHAVGYWSSTG